MKLKIALFIILFHRFIFSCSAQQVPGITDFTSLSPLLQTGNLIIPPSHNFQWLTGTGDYYSTGGGVVPDRNDFAGFIPINGSSEHGFLCVNHETFPGAVGVYELIYDSSRYKWNILNSRKVNLNLPLGTAGNCSGHITPWKTMISCEELTTNTDLNFDGYEDYGWCFEVDPVTATVMEYGTGSSQKLWKLGCMAHENLVVAKDSIHVYYGEDGNTSCMYKFIADQPGNLFLGTMYSLKLDDPFNGGIPSGTTGTWVPIPNSTKQECNDANITAYNLGCNDFSGVEDVEINPITGYIYFASKNNGRVYRFQDDGTTISNFEVIAGGTDYLIQTANGNEYVSWGSGNDNMAFDTTGNLWVYQDGGNNYIWLLKNTHSPQNPQVSIFGISPIGSEPTGVNLTPDNRFLFMSVQHPSGSNGAQFDATGKRVSFNRSATIVIAREELLHPLQKVIYGTPAITIYPNPAHQYFHLDDLPEISDGYELYVYNSEGQLVKEEQGLYIDEYSNIFLPELNPGLYICRFRSGSATFNKKFVVN